MRQRAADARLIHHTFQANDLGATVTSMGFFMDGLATGSEAVTVNPGFPRAVKLVGVFLYSGCAIVNSAGDWTFRLKDGATGSDLATCALGMTALPSPTKFAGQMSSQVIIQAGVSYYVNCDGPSRNIAVARAILEWEVL